MDQVMQFVDPAKQFAKDSLRLVKRCTKPDRKEFQKIAMATAIGFGIMGFIGFFVKLIHIPINNIIVMDLYFSCFSTKPYNVGTRKNRLTDPDLYSGPPSQHVNRLHRHVTSHIHLIRED